jgi:hypothetical protein
MLKLFFTFLFLFFSAGFVQAKVTDACVKKYIQKPSAIGEGRLKVMLWDVYDARLYGSQGRFDKNSPFALRLNYLRDIDGADIVDASVEEMKSLGYKNKVKLQVWRNEMLRVFPDVKKGDSISGLNLGKGKVVFCKNGKKIGDVTDADFAAAFFDIWLSPKTSEPSLRKKLLGMK